MGFRACSRSFLRVYFVFCCVVVSTHEGSLAGVWVEKKQVC